MRGKVSIIMPCFNAQSTVSYAIKSLERQTYDNFELIAVDDGSLDDTAKVIESFVGKVKFDIVLVRQENKGVAAARNEALVQAGGDCIAFLDADDVYDDRFLEILVNAMEKNDGADIALCSFKRIGHIDYEGKKKYSDKYIEMTQKELADNLMYRNIPSSLWSYLYKRKKIVDNFLKFTENVHYGEDSEFLWKYIVNCKSGVAVKDELYYYYDNPQSALNNLNWNKVQSADVIKRVHKYMKDNNISWSEEFFEYMYPRTLLAIYKMFIKNNKTAYAKKFEEEYNLKAGMKKLLKSPDFKIKCTAAVYLTCPKICEIILRRI